MPGNWKPFNYADYESGLFWLLVESQEVDIDADDDGRTVGRYTGEMTRAAVLAMVEEGDEGMPYFDPVDRENAQRIDQDCTVTHFAKVVAPALPASEPKKSKLVITPCRNCRQKPEIVRSGDEEYPFVLRHKPEDVCYHTYKLETYQRTEVECAKQWNEFNKG